MPEIQINLKKLQKLMTDGFEKLNPSAIREKDIVLLIGATGAGKSTIVNYMIGRQMVSTKTRDGLPVIDVAGGKSSPKIGHEVGPDASETLYPAPYEGRDNNKIIIYCDMPGHHDLGDIERNLVISTFVCRTIKLARSVKVMLVINYNALTSVGHGRQFLELCELLKNIFKDIQEIQHSMMVVITGGPTIVYEKTTKNTVRIQAEGFLKAYLSNLARRLYNLIQNNVDNAQIDDMKREYQIVNSILSCCKTDRLISIDVLDNGNCRGRIIDCLHNVQPVATRAFDFGQFDEKRNMFVSKMRAIAARGLKRFSKRRQHNESIKWKIDSINQKENIIIGNNRTIDSLRRRRDQGIGREAEIQALKREKQPYEYQNNQRTAERNQRQDRIQNLTGQIQIIDQDGESDVRHWVATAPNHDLGFINYLRRNLPENWLGNAAINIMGPVLEFAGMNVRSVHTFEYPYHQDHPIARVERRRSNGGLVAVGSLRVGEAFINRGTNLQEGQFKETHQAPFGENPDMVVTAFVKRKDLANVRLNRNRIVNELNELRSGVNILEHAINDNDAQKRNLEERIRRLDVPEMTVAQLNQEIKNLEDQNKRITTEELPRLRNELQRLESEKSTKVTRKLENDIRLFDYVERILNSLSLESLENPDERTFFEAFLNEYAAFRNEDTLFIHYRREEARTVHLAGAFNNWLNNNSGRISADSCVQWKMRKLDLDDKKNCWILTVPLNRGVHSFKYVINEGEAWETDPRYGRDNDGNSVMNAGDFIRGYAIDTDNTERPANDPPNNNNYNAFQQHTFFGAMPSSANSQTEIPDILSLLERAEAIPRDGKVELIFTDKEIAKAFQQALMTVGIYNLNEPNYARKIELRSTNQNNNNVNLFVLPLTDVEYNAICQDDEAYSRLVEEATRSEIPSL